MLLLHAWVWVDACTHEWAVAFRRRHATCTRSLAANHRQPKARAASSVCASAAIMAAPRTAASMHAPLHQRHRQHRTALVGKALGTHGAGCRYLPGAQRTAAQTAPCLRCAPPPLPLMQAALPARAARPTDGWLCGACTWQGRGWGPTISIIIIITIMCEACLGKGGMRHAGCQWQCPPSPPYTPGQRCKCFLRWDPHLHIGVQPADIGCKRLL